MHANENHHLPAEIADLDAIAARHRDASPGPWTWADMSADAGMYDALARPKLPC